MKRYAELLDRLYYTYGHKEKIALLMQYFAMVPDPDRGYALALMSGDFQFKFLTRPFIKSHIYKKVDPFLFDLSYDYVGDLSETIAHFWTLPNETPAAKEKVLPTLSVLVNHLLQYDKAQAQNYFIELMDAANLIERWALLKLAFHNLRVGVSSRFLKQTLAEYGEQSISDIEEIWHALTPPYLELFSWLEKKSEKPKTGELVFFQPVMLCQSLEDKDLASITPEQFYAEWKYDGIRIQYNSTGEKSALYSRTGDDISSAFPEICAVLAEKIVLDGELVIKTDNGFGSFNDLQQRLNRKRPSQKLIQASPGHIIVYDLLLLDEENLRGLPLLERRKRLEQWIENSAPSYMSISPLLAFTHIDNLKKIREQLLLDKQAVIEGLILKRKLSSYLAGRPAGQWYKWKRNPFLIDAVLMYAQRGHGKRSSFYSDYTFGLWKNGVLLPVGKAYFGFTDEELKKLDHWIRHHKIQKFGPVLEVEKSLVFEVAFEDVLISNRHKAGYALRFPRINRIRWDKPAQEADQLEALRLLLSK